MPRATLITRYVSALAARTAAALPSPARRAVISALFDRDETDVVEALAPKYNRSPTLDAIEWNLGRPEGGQLVQFEDLAGLFHSNRFNQGVISQDLGGAAYMFGVTRRLPARKAIEIGRWRGGGTVLLAAAMGPEGELWSIDNSEKEARMAAETQHVRPFDEQTSELLERLGLQAHLLNGDSHSIDVETGEVDLVFIDGDHSFEGTVEDFDRFGRRVRVGGAVIFDDVGGLHESDVAEAMRHVLASSDDFAFVRQVGLLAHVRRTH